MALIKCPECSSEISDKASNCPRCGYPISAGLVRQGPPTMPAAGSTHDEEVIYEIHPSRKPVLLMMGFLVLFFLMFWLPSRNQPAFGGLMSFLLVVLIAVTALMDLRRAKTVYTLTSDRVRLKTGIVGRFERTIPLAKIQNVTSGFGILQRLMRIGNIVIESAGELTGRVYMLGVDTPLEYADRIIEAVKAQHRQAA